MNQQQQREFILKQLEIKRNGNVIDLFKEWQMKEEEKILNQQRSFYRATVWSL